MKDNTLVLLIILIILIVILLIIVSNFNKTKYNNKYYYNKDNKDNIEKKQILHNDSDIQNTEYTIQIDNPDISYSTDNFVSIDTIDLYPDQYPYTFGYKPYYYRLYPYPLRPQYHYRKKNGTWLF